MCHSKPPYKIIAWFDLQQSIVDYWALYREIGIVSRVFNGCWRLAVGN